jgi:hypothetical protein
MDLYLSNNQNRANSFDPPPVLIAGDTPGARKRARATVAAAGLRATDTPLPEAAARLDEQIAASALWIEIEREREEGGGANALLDHISRTASAARFPTIVAVPAALLDRFAPHALEAHFDMLVDADESERCAALALALARANRSDRLSDVTADKNAARLRQLSDEVSRIAATLARLSTGPAATSRPVEVDARGEAPEVSVEIVRTIIRARRLRSRYFPEELFADPAWDMLLDLLQAEISKLRVPVSSLCIAAAVPATTALRWLKTMVQEGLFLRRADPHDGRRVFVELAPHASQALRRYFAEVGQLPVI